MWTPRAPRVGDKLFAVKYNRLKDKGHDFKTGEWSGWDGSEMIITKPMFEDEALEFIEMIKTQYSIWQGYIELIYIKTVKEFDLCK